MSKISVFSRKIMAFMLICAVAIGQFAFSNADKVYAEESTAYNIKVNLGTNCVTIYKDGKAVKAMICSPSSETPVGTFYTPVKYRWHLMIGNCYAQYCTRITGQVLFHSVWYYRQYDNSSMSVAAYNVMRNKASHGCVRLLCKDAKWIYDNCALNTRVDIFWGSASDDPIERPSFTPITDGSFTNWDPTDPDPANPWNKTKPTITQLVKSVEYKSNVNIYNMINVKDSTGNKLSNDKIKVQGSINTNKLGSYDVTVTAKDSLGHSQTADFTFNVVDTKQPEIKGVKDHKNLTRGSSMDVVSGVKAYTATGENITSKLEVTAKRGKSNKKLEIKDGKLTFAKAGTYTVKYFVKGENGRSVTKRASYEVIDKRVKAEFVANKIKVEYGEKVNPYFFIKKLTSYNGRRISRKAKNVLIEGKLNTKKPGTYKLKYTMTDEFKEYTDITKTITVVVKKKTKKSKNK